MFEVFFNIWSNLYLNIIIDIIILTLTIFFIVLLLFIVFFNIIKLLILIWKFIHIKKKNKQIIDKIKKYYRNNLNNKSWEEFFRLLISYIENFITEYNYSNLYDILRQIWLTKEEIKKIELIIHSNKWNDKDLEKKTKNILT